MKTNRTYNTVVFSDNIEFLNEVVSRCPYECVELGEGRYGFMDNKNGDIRDYFCDTLGYALGQEGFDFEYLDEPKKDRYTKEVEGMRVEAYFINEKTPLEELKESGDKKNIREMIEAKERALANAMENVEYYASVGNKEFADNEQTRVNRLNKDLANLRASLELPPANDITKSPNTSYGTSEMSLEKVLAVNLRKGDIVVKKSGRTSTIVSIDRRTKTGTFATLVEDESGDIYTISYCNSQVIPIKRLGDIFPKQVEAQPRSPGGLAPSGYMVPA